MWLSILALHRVIFAELNRVLLDQVGISLAKFDALAQLYRYPDGLNMSQLSKALKVSNGNVSGLVNRLVKDGLVAKAMAKEDRRSFNAMLTLEGKEAFEKALGKHRMALSKFFEDLPPEELSETVDALRGLVGKLNVDSGNE